MTSPIRTLAVIFSIVAVVNAAPTPTNSEIYEKVEIAMGPLGTQGGALRAYNATVGSTCIEIQETVLPTILKLNNVDPDYYRILTFGSPDCNGRSKPLEATSELILNDRYPVCAFKLNIEEGSRTGKVLVTFYFMERNYSKTLTDETSRNTHDICNVHSGQFKLANRITVYSENPSVNEITLFRESHPPEELDYVPVVARNGTNIASETLKTKKLVRAVKIIPNNDSI